MGQFEEAMARRAEGRLLDLVGYRLIEATDEHIVAEMTYRKELSQFTELFHTGALLTLADTAATMACVRAVDPTGEGGAELFPLAIQLNANLVRNTGEGTITAEARMTHRGRTTMVVGTTVRDERGRTLVVCTTTHVVLPAAPAVTAESPYNPVVAELGRLPERLDALLTGRSEEQLRQRSGAESWSPKEIACHLRDAARIYHERLFLTATHERPFLPGYDEAALARDLDYQNVPAARIVPEVRSWRDETVDLLAGLPSEAWDRPALHEERGEMTLLQIAAHMVEHEAEHIADLRRLLAPESTTA